MELLRCLGTLVEPPGEKTGPLAALLDLEPVPDTGQHADLFLFQLYPFASVYLDNQGKIGGEARDRVAGFWRALELTAPPEPDHLTILLAFYSLIREREADAKDQGRWRHVRRAFLWEHLLSWIPGFVDKVRQLDRGFYRGWAEILAQALIAEAVTIERPEGLPLHLRQAESVLDPREGSGEAFLESLLSPVRSGVILTRDDLQRAGRDLELGVRKGERRYVLKALLSQDDASTLTWLSREATLAAGRHQAWQGITGDIARFWAERAVQTANLLVDLAADLRS